MMLLVSSYWGSHISVGKMAFVSSPYERQGLVRALPLGHSPHKRRVSSLSVQSLRYSAGHSPGVEGCGVSVSSQLCIPWRTSWAQASCHFLVLCRKPTPERLGSTGELCSSVTGEGGAGWPSGLLRTSPSGLKAVRVKDALDRLGQHRLHPLRLQQTDLHGRDSPWTQL